MIFNNPVFKPINNPKVIDNNNRFQSQIPQQANYQTQFNIQQQKKLEKDEKYDRIFQSDTDLSSRMNDTLFQTFDNNKMNIDQESYQKNIQNNSDDSILNSSFMGIFNGVQINNSNMERITIGMNQMESLYNKLGDISEVSTLINNNNNNNNNNNINNNNNNNNNTSTKNATNPQNNTKTDQNQLINQANQQKFEQLNIDTDSHNNNNKNYYNSKFLNLNQNNYGVINNQNKFTRQTNNINPNDNTTLVDINHNSNDNQSKNNTKIINSNSIGNGNTNSYNISGNKINNNSNIVYNIKGNSNTNTNVNFGINNNFVNNINNSTDNNGNKNYNNQKSNNLINNNDYYYIQKPQNTIQNQQILNDKQYKNNQSQNYYPPSKLVSPRTQNTRVVINESPDVIRKRGQTNFLQNKLRSQPDLMFDDQQKFKKNNFLQRPKWESKDNLSSMTGSNDRGISCANCSQMISFNQLQQHQIECRDDNLTKKQNKLYFLGELIQELNRKLQIARDNIQKIFDDNYHNSSQNILEIIDFIIINDKDVKLLQQQLNKIDGIIKNIMMQRQDRILMPIVSMLERVNLLGDEKKQKIEMVYFDIIDEVNDDIYDEYKEIQRITNIEKINLENWKNQCKIMLDQKNQAYQSDLMSNLQSDIKTQFINGNSMISSTDIQYQTNIDQLYESDDVQQTNEQELKKSFYKLAVSCKLNLPYNHEAKNILIQDIYEKSIRLNIKENQWDQFIMYEMNQFRLS